MFELDEIPIYDDAPPARIGVLINFHMGSHPALDKAVETALANSGSIAEPLADMGDGVRYLILRDPEGNSIALSSYEPADEENAE